LTILHFSRLAHLFDAEPARGHPRLSGADAWGGRDRDRVCP